MRLSVCAPVRRGQIVLYCCPRKDKQRVMKENKTEWERAGKKVKVESQACQLLLQQLEVLARSCAKALFLLGFVSTDFTVSLVSTPLGDNRAFGRVSALAQQVSGLYKNTHDCSLCILMITSKIHVSLFFIAQSHARFDLSGQGSCVFLRETQCGSKRWSSFRCVCICVKVRGKKVVAARELARAKIRNCSAIKVALPFVFCLTAYNSRDLNFRLLLVLCLLITASGKWVDLFFNHIWRFIRPLSLFQGDEHAIKLKITFLYASQCLEWRKGRLH